MWEAIEANRFRSRALIALLALLLVALGVSIGLAVDPASGAPVGGAVALLVWLILWMVAAFQGDQIMLGSVGAREIEKDDAPLLWNVVEEMTIAAGLPKMPRVYLIESDALNAFAVGRTPEKAAVAVTSGLVRKLNRDELQGVIAHEIGHVKNLDIRFMTLAAVMVGAIALIADVFWRSLRHGVGGRRRSGGKGDGGAAVLFLVIALVFAVLAPILAQMLYFACSRRREYLADASAARFTRFPEGLASALERIALRSLPATFANRSIVPLFIVNPRQAFGRSGLFSTHPPTESRIKILRSMGGHAGYAEYESAFKGVFGRNRHLIGPRSLAEAASEPVRAPSEVAAAEPPESTVRSREALDFLDRLGNFIPIPCPCGMRIKLPPSYAEPQARCPRCGRTHTVPRAEEIAELNAPAAKLEPFRYTRTGHAWEAFKCPCGKTLQLSPSFHARKMKCGSCHRRIEIVSPAAVSEGSSEDPALYN